MHMASSDDEINKLRVTADGGSCLPMPPPPQVERLAAATDAHQQQHLRESNTSSDVATVAVRSSEVEDLIESLSLLLIDSWVIPGCLFQQTGLNGKLPPHGFFRPIWARVCWLRAARITGGSKQNSDRRRAY